MKKFTDCYYDYRDFSPLAVSIENAVNTCGSLKEHIVRITDIFKNEEKMKNFFMACIAYWSEIKHFDGRNQYAVCMSREIAKNFAYITSTDYDEETLKTAYAFTMSAHRYLQNELFKAISYYFESIGDEIYTWLNEMDFVILDDNTTMRYKDWKRMKYGYC